MQKNSLNLNPKTNNRLTEGPILKSIILLAIPIVIANLLQSMYQIIDTFWVGRLGKEAVAAVSLSFPIIMLIITFSGGIGLAGAVLVAQYKGSGNSKMVNHVVGQTFFIVFLSSLFFSIIGYLLSPFIIQLLGAEADVIPSANSYLKISFIGLIFIFGYMVYQSLARGVGDVKTPMYIVLLTVALNAVLDPLFIFGYGIIPAMGVSGAAVATVLTQGIALFIGLGVFFSGKFDIHLKKSDLKPDYNFMKKIVRLGLPSSIEQSSRAVGFIVMTIIVASFGTVTLASYGIGMRIISLIIMPALSLSIVNSTLVGQNFGARKIDRAKSIIKISGIFGFVLLSLLGVLFFIFATPIVKLFIPNDLEVIKMGSLFIRVIAFSFGFIGIQMTLSGSFRGAGDTKITMIIAMSVMVVQLSFAIILSKFTSLGTTGLWISMPISNVFGAIISVIVYRRGKWSEKKVI